MGILFSSLPKKFTSQWAVNFFGKLENNIPIMELIQILCVCCISNNLSKKILREGYAWYLKKNDLVILWINDRSRRGKFFFQAGKQYSHYSN